MRTSLEPEHLAKLTTEQTGLEFEAESGVDGDGQHWYLLRPCGLPTDQTFVVRTTLGWRRLKIEFEPGKFAAQLLATMAKHYLGRSPPIVSFVPFPVN